MAKTTTTLAFSELQYLSIAKRAVKYLHEDKTFASMPLIPTKILDQEQYKHTGLLQPDVSQGVKEWSAVQKIAEGGHNSETFELAGRQMLLNMSYNETQKLGAQLIADKRDGYIAQWSQDIDYALGHGVISKGVKLNKGILEQSTIVENLNGTDSKLTTKGDGWKAIKKMVETIPLAKRQNAGGMTLRMTENFYNQISAPARIYQDRQEWDFIYDKYMGPKAIDTQKITKVIITDKIECIATDTASGEGGAAADTGGSTDDRLLLTLEDIRFMARVYSRGPSLVDEQARLLNIDQLWGWKGGACVFASDAAQLSEKIVWA